MWAVSILLRFAVRGLAKPMTKHLLLARHAETGPQYAGRFVGRTDPPLSANGVRQAASLGEVIRQQARASPAGLAYQHAAE